MAGVLDRDPLLAVDGLARNQVGSGKQIFLSTASNEDTLVTMGLYNNLPTARTAMGTTAAAARTALSD